MTTPLPRPLITAAELHARLAGAEPPVVIDCSFDLMDPAAGERAWRAGHVPGALYWHLDRDLADHARPAGAPFRGRHPLPTREAFAATCGAAGIGPATPVVVYDRQGASFAARAWWMLRWIGHAEVAVLDGGLSAWTAFGGALETTEPPRRTAPPHTLAPTLTRTVDTETLQAALGRVCLIDARAAERYRGEVEPLDPVAGHIPGALNRPFKDNLDAAGRLLPPATLHDVFVALIGSTDTEAVVHQCGSGVTACHNLLAMEAAGLPGAALYPGSWSEWCADPARPVARG